MNNILKGSCIPIEGSKKEDRALPRPPIAFFKLSGDSSLPTFVLPRPFGMPLDVFFHLPRKSGSILSLNVGSIPVEDDVFSGDCTVSMFASALSDFDRKCLVMIEDPCSWNQWENEADSGC